jgi:hypothetical protein
MKWLPRAVQQRPPLGGTRAADTGDRFALLRRLAVAERDVLALCQGGIGDPTLTPHAHLGELRQRLRARAASPRLDPDGRLRRSGNGYGGVELRDPFRLPLGAPADPIREPYRPRETWRVFAGYISRHTGDEVRCWADPQFELEEWLVGLLQAAGASVPTEETRALHRRRAMRSAVRPG